MSGCKRPTKKQLKVYWKHLEQVENTFYRSIEVLEKLIEQDTGIEDAEFFWCDNEIVGLGNRDRTMKLMGREYET